MLTLFDLAYIAAPAVGSATGAGAALYLYWKLSKSLREHTDNTKEIAEEDIFLTNRDWGSLTVITAALIKCGLLQIDCEPSKDLIGICFMYIIIDEKQTKSEMFNALVKRFEDHFNTKSIDSTVT